MTYRNASAPASPVGRTLAAITRMLALATALSIVGGTVVYAQSDTTKSDTKKTTKKTAKDKDKNDKDAPKQAPAAQAPPQGDAQQQVQLIYSPWTKFCRKDESTGDKQVCFTGVDARLDTGMMIGSMTVFEVEGAPKMIRVAVPIAVQLPPGTRLVMDQGKDEGQVLTAPYHYCGPDAPLCVAEYELTPETLAKLKKTQLVTIQAVPLTAKQAMSIPLPMGEFLKAHDGPPTDPKVFQAQQEKLQQELQKRADDARKKMEQQQGAAQPAPKQ
jgi:invasion protein IalB